MIDPLDDVTIRTLVTALTPLYEHTEGKHVTSKTENNILIEVGLMNIAFIDCLLHIERVYGKETATRVHTQLRRRVHALPNM